MNRIRKILYAVTTAAFLVLWLPVLSAQGEASGLDKAVGALGEKLVPNIQKAGLKKIAVVDFLDLQGKPTEYGRFVAEQLSVEMVDRRAGFAVMDRANFNAILREHKWTADGIVEPGNTVSLHQLSGIDALIIGVAVPIGESMEITAKVLNTESGEIAGAAKAKFPRSKQDEGLSQGIGAEAKQRKFTQKIGDLVVAFDSFQTLEYGNLMVNLVFQNVGEKQSIGVAMYRIHELSQALKATVITPDGIEYQSSTSNTTGIRGLRSDGTDLTEIRPKSELTVAIKFIAQNGRPELPVTAFRLQADIVMDANYSASSYPKSQESGFFHPNGDPLPRNCRLHGLALAVSTK